jgi:IclR family acetate operon transcriptional repressor
MAVKRSKSGSRMLAVLEAVARHQPVGLAELARLLEEDKSGVQRSLMTLADAGWISLAPGAESRWRLTSHIQVVAQFARENDDLRRAARPVMERLRQECGESVLLAVPDQRQLVVVDVVESEHLVRTAPRIGLVIASPRASAARAVLAFWSAAGQEAFLGRAPDADEIADYAATRSRGYAVNTHTHTETQEGAAAIGSTNISAPVIDHDGAPVAALVVSGPSERLSAEWHAAVGGLAAKAARELSWGVPVGEGAVRRTAPQSDV